MYVPADGRSSGNIYLASFATDKEKFSSFYNSDVRECPLSTENGYLTMDPTGLITLTEAGMAIASNIYERHKLLTRLLLHIGVSEENARDDACKVEHDISEETFNALKRCVERIDKK